MASAVAFLAPATDASLGRRPRPCQHPAPNQLPLPRPRQRQLRWHRVLSDAQESPIKLTAAATRTVLSQQLAASGTPHDIKWVVQQSLEQLEPDQLALAANRCARRRPPRVGPAPPAAQAGR
jgi:hypothetical protein